MGKVKKGNWATGLEIRMDTVVIERVARLPLVKSKDRQYEFLIEFYVVSAHITFT